MKKLFSLILALSAASASAQDLLPEIAACSKDKSSVSRLACFDSLAAKHAAPTTTNVTLSNSKWRLSTDSSKIDDSKTVILSLDADSSIKGWPNKTETPTLIIRCKEQKTEAYIFTGMSPMVEYGTNGATIRFRIDKKPAFKLRAGKSTDGEALFIPSAINQLKKMMGGSILLFEFTPFNSSPQMTTFDINGINDAIKPIRETCKW